MSYLLTTLEQITNAKQPAKGPRIHYNPNPPGSIKEGSATEAVLAFLESTGCFHTMAQIMWKTGRSHSAVSWALIRLLQSGKVESIDDPTRHARYKRYRARKAEA